MNREERDTNCFSFGGKLFDKIPSKKKKETLEQKHKILIKNLM